MSTSDRDTSASETPAAEPVPGAEAELDSTAESPAEPEAELERAAAGAPPPAESVPEDAPVESIRTKKRRRKRRREPDRVESEMRPELDDKGRERPRFLLAFPKDAELEKLIVAFEVGNYARVRVLGPKLIQTSENPEVQAAAREVLRRIEPDPLVKLLLFVAVALFVVVVAYAYHSHA